MSREKNPVPSNSQQSAILQFCVHLFNCFHSNGHTEHNFEDVPVDDIESGRYGPTLAWTCEPGDVIAFYGKFN
jgi:hypothetical protein